MSQLRLAASLNCILIENKGILWLFGARLILLNWTRRSIWSDRTSFDLLVVSNKVASLCQQQRRKAGKVDSHWVYMPPAIPLDMLIGSLDSHWSISRCGISSCSFKSQRVRFTYKDIHAANKTIKKSNLDRNDRISI